MGDVMTRLKREADGAEFSNRYAGLLQEAADEIDRLRAGLKRIAEAEDMYEPCGWAVLTARSALSPTQEERS